MTSGVSYPAASTPDPTVHRAPSNQLNQFAFVAGYLEAVGQQMLSAFTQVIVQALVGLVTGKSLPQLQAQLSGWGAALESAAEGAAENIATIIDGTLGLGHTAEDLVTFLENTASDATSATGQFEDLLTDTTAPDIAALAVIINNASLGAGGFLTLLLDTGAANATVLAGTLNTAVSDASAAVADLATLLSAAGSATVTVLGALIAAASTDASGAVAELAAFVSGMGAGSMAALITAQNTANTAATSARADIDAVLSALGLSLPIASLSSYLSATESDASTAISNFGALLSATGAANVAALGTYLSTANSNASAAVTDITNLLSATGQADVAALSTFLTDTNNDAVASLGNWTTILSAMTLANAADLASYITGANTNANLAVTAIGSLISGVGGAAIADVVALINLIQQIIDAIANALGHPGTGHTPSQVQGYMEPIPPIVNGWTTALAELNLLNPLALIQQIPQSIPALVRDADGGLTAVGSGLTRGVDGAITFVEDGLTHLAKQDGGLLSLPAVTQHMVHVASVIGTDVNAGVADVMDAGQKAHTALTGAVEAARVTVEGDIVAGANAFGAVVDTTKSNALGLIGGVNNAAAGLLTGGSALVADAEANFAALFAGPAQYLQGLSGIFGQQASNAAYKAAADQAAAHAIELSNQQSAFNAVFNVSPSTAGNINVAIDFTGVANQSGMSGIMLPGTGSGSGFLGVTSGEAAWQGGLGSPGDVEVFPTQTVSDYMLIEITLGNLKDILAGDATLNVPFRCNSARTVYNYLLIYGDGAGHMFLGVNAMNSGTPSLFYNSAALSLSSGGKVRVYAGDPTSLSPYAFQVLYQGTPVITQTDSAHKVPVGSAQRYIGLWGFVTNSAHLPPQIKSITYADNPPPPSSYPYSGLPTAGTKGRQYWPNDVGLALRDNGVAWETIWGGPLGAFTTPPTTGWSWVNQGSASTATELGGERITAPSAAGRNLRIQARTLSPTSNYTATAYLEAAGAPATSWNAGILLRNSSTGNMLSFGPSVETTNGSTLAVYRWGSATSFGSTSFIEASSQLAHGIIPNWYRFRDDGTDRYFEYSLNGGDWIPAYFEARSVFTGVDQFGFYADNEASGADVTIRLRSLAGIS